MYRFADHWQKIVGYIPAPAQRSGDFRRVSVQENRHADRFEWIQRCKQESAYPYLDFFDFRGRFLYFF